MVPQTGKTQAYLILLTTFVLGGLVGGVVTHFFQQRPAAAPVAVIDRIDERVHLNSEQRAKVETVLADYHRRYNELRVQLRPQYQGLRETARDKIRPLLTPEQIESFNQWVKELDEKRAAQYAAQAKELEQKK